MEFLFGVVIAALAYHAGQLITLLWMKTRQQRKDDEFMEWLYELKDDLEKERR